MPRGRHPGAISPPAPRQWHAPAGGRPMLCGPSRARRGMPRMRSEPILVASDTNCYKIIAAVLKSSLFLKLLKLRGTRTTFASLSTMPTRAQHVEIVIYEDASKDMVRCLL
jgi:hypothetical protein